MLAFVISHRLSQIVKWPVIIVGLAFVLALFAGAAWGTFALARLLWRRLTRREFFAFALWLLVNFALALAATLTTVHRAASQPSGQRLSNHYVTVWALEWGVSMVFVAVLGGLFVFRRATPWRTLLSWPWLVGIVVGVAYTVGISGQMDSGSKLCDAPSGGSCDTAWGLGAWVLGFIAAAVFGGIFVASASLVRLLPRRSRQA